MARAIPGWVGKTDDTPPSASCKRRILARQDHRCAISGQPFTAKEKPKFDHITPLWLGGKNCESNLQAIADDPHKAKTATEATVRAKIDAVTNAHFGLSNAKKQPIRSAGFPKPAKRKALSSDLPPLPKPSLYREATQ